MTPSRSSPPALLAFDVNETLLSLEPVKARLEEAFGAAPPIGEWFARMLHGSLVANEIGAYRPFADIGVEALLTVAAKHGVAMKGEQALEIVEAMTDLPSHPDVYNALERLFDSGLTMVAVTNGSTKAANAQIENAGLHIFIQRVISVEEVGLFKPAAEIYVHTASLMGVNLPEMMLVAAHDWDCAGAMASGAQAAFVKRTGVVWSLPVAPPAVVVDDVSKLADVLLA